MSEKDEYNDEVLESEEQFKTLNKNLQNLGFSLNDSKIYITLLKIGLSSPSKISEQCKVDRARVYDSLKRLVKRGIVQEEPVPRAPRYRAYEPSQVFGKIRKEYLERIKLSEDLEEQLMNIKSVSKDQNSVWALKGSQKIKRKINQFLDDSKDIFYLVITPDISSTNREFLIIVERILEKKYQNPEIEIKVALKVNPQNSEQKSLVNRLFHEQIEIYNWNSGLVFPFGLMVSDLSYVQTFLNSITPRPRYESGIFMEHCSEEQIKGLIHLCKWVFGHLCQRVVFSKKKNKKPNGEM